eukprot:194462-Rhodomonas_salina.1
MATTRSIQKRAQWKPINKPFVASCSSFRVMVSSSSSSRVSVRKTTRQTPEIRTMAFCLNPTQMQKQRNIIDTH